MNPTHHSGKDQGIDFLLAENNAAGTGKFLKQMRV